MFTFSRDGEELEGVRAQVFRCSTTPSSKRSVGARRRRRHDPLSTLPFTSDTLDPRFITGGRDFLLYATARAAIDELRGRQVCRARPFRAKAARGRDICARSLRRSR